MPSPLPSASPVGLQLLETRLSKPDAIARTSRRVLVIAHTPRPRAPRARVVRRARSERARGEARVRSSGESRLPTNMAALRLSRALLLTAGTAAFRINAFPAARAVVPPPAPALVASRSLYAPAPATHLPSFFSTLLPDACCAWTPARRAHGCTAPCRRMAVAPSV